MLYLYVHVHIYIMSELVNCAMSKLHQTAIVHKMYVHVIYTCTQLYCYIVHTCSHVYVQTHISVQCIYMMVYMYMFHVYLCLRVSSAPSLAFINTSSIVVIDISQLDTPSTSHSADDMCECGTCTCNLCMYMYMCAYTYMCMYIHVCTCTLQ